MPCRWALWIWGLPGLQSEFQVNQSYTKRPCLKGRKEKRKGRKLCPEVRVPTFTLIPLIAFITFSRIFPKPWRKWCRCPVYGWVFIVIYSQYFYQLSLNSHLRSLQKKKKQKTKQNKTNKKKTKKQKTNQTKTARHFSDKGWHQEYSLSINTVM